MYKTKKCDGCHYCVQTDKTGKKPLAAVKVANQMLCPYYPGFAYRFFEIDDEVINNVIELLKFIDDLVITENNK